MAPCSVSETDFEYVGQRRDKNTLTSVETKHTGCRHKPRYRRGYRRVRRIVIASDSHPARPFRPHRGRVKRRAGHGPPTHPHESITALYRQLRDSQLSAVESHFHASTHSEIERATAGSNGASSSRPCETVKHNQGGVDHFGRSNGRQCSPRRAFAPQPTGARPTGSAHHGAPSPLNPQVHAPPARCRRAGLGDSRRQATQRSTLN